MNELITPVVINKDREFVLSPKKEPVQHPSMKDPIQLMRRMADGKDWLLSFLLMYNPRV